MMATRAAGSLGRPAKGWTPPPPLKYSPLGGGRTAFMEMSQDARLEGGRRVFRLTSQEAGLWEAGAKWS